MAEVEIEFFNSEKLIRLTPLTEQTVRVAENILSLSFMIFPKLHSVGVKSFDAVWEMEFPSSERTYRLYLYALYPVSYLINAYEVSGEERYLDGALELVISFLRWESERNEGLDLKKRKLLYGDHSVSNRVQCLCYLSVAMSHSGREVPESVLQAMLDGGLYLSNNDNYSQYNHGLMMDLSLLCLINCLEGLRLRCPLIFREVLCSRLKHSINRDLTRDGVHVENSPGYHFWYLRFLRKIIRPLSLFDHGIHQNAMKALKNALEYAAAITRPDGTVPKIGDTHAGVKYKSEVGKASCYFKYADQVIFRSPDDSVWAHFSSGYKTHVHKHCDNGSFNLYHAGRDVFVDPGFLSYEGHGESLEIKGSSFHNTVRPLNEEQVIGRVDLSEAGLTYSENVGGSRVSGYQDFGCYEAALCEIADYESAIIERLIVWFKPNVFLIADVAKSSCNGLEQFFHVDSEAIVSVKEGKVDLISDFGDCFCRIRQYEINGKDMVLSSSASAEVLPGISAVKFNQSADSHRVRFETMSAGFFTVVQVGERLNDEGEVDISDFISASSACLNVDVGSFLNNIKKDLSQ